jgi:F0F1-type ATP synthase membrane subunit b/b'
MSNPEKPNLEAALSSTPVAAKKSRFRPTFRSPRIPRETKLGLAIIFSLVCVFGYVLYSRLTRPTDMDAEQFAAQGKTVLEPSVTSNQPTALTAQPTSLVAQPAGHSPTMLSGTAPQNALPLTNPNNHPASPSQYGAPTGGAGQAAWSPNASNPSAAQPNSDPFMNRGATTAGSTPAAASSFSANGFGANSTASNTTPSTTTPAATPSYGLSDTNDAADSPRNSFSPLPPADRATSGLTASGTAGPAGPTSLSQPEHATTTNSNPSGSPVDAFNKSATDSFNKIQQEGQNLVNAGTTSQQNLGKAADNAGQLLNQAQQQLGQNTNTAGNNTVSLLNQANQAATQYGTELKTSVQNQASQYSNQLQNTAQDQFQQAQNQLRNGANNLVNDTTNQLRSTTESVMTKAGDSTQNLMNSATTSLSGGQPLTPLPTTASSINTTGSSAGATQPASGYGMPTAAAPRTLDHSQTVSQPLNNSALSNAAYSTTQPQEQPIRIPADNISKPTTQPLTATQPNYGTATNLTTTPNYGAAANTTTTPSYGTATTTPNYGTTPAYGGAPTTPAASGTPLQFNQPTMPAAQPTTPVYNGATRTNFEQPASAAATGVQQYMVTAQDSYYSVAEKMYGNGGFNKALYEYNRRNNPAADRLQVGGAMLVPDLGTLQAQFPELVPNAAATATINPTPLQFPR